MGHQTPGRNALNGLAHRLPSVQYKQFDFDKLEIFDDCEVAIRVETGQW